MKSQDFLNTEIITATKSTNAWGHIAKKVCVYHVYRCIHKQQK